MSPGSYNGKRVASASSAPDSSPVRRKSGGNPLLRLVFFPLLFIYFEFFLHVFLSMPLKFTVIHVMFGIAAGFLFTAFTLPFRRKVNRIVMKSITVLFTLVYVIEMICKQILQSFYQLSMLGTAAGNKLTDYSDVIISTVIKDIPLIIVFFLPFLLLCLFGRRFMGYHRFHLRFSGFVLVAALVFHLVGLGVIHLPWSGDLTPKLLYHMDTNVDDQVEQLGLLNMLRLDLKHKIVPAKNPVDDDFTEIGGLGDGSENDSPDPSVSEPEGPVVDRSPNVMDVDLTALAESTGNEDVAWLANFFNSVTPTNKNEYTGMFKDYNVIVLCLEGFSGYAIDPQLTPTLYKLSHEGFVFNNFYTPLHFTSTSNGECQTLLGLYPRNGHPITMTRTGELKDNMYFSLAQQLLREGYKVMGFHGNSDMYGRLASHSNLGYEFHQIGAGLDCEADKNGKPLWPQRDSYVIEASVDDYLYSTTPFHVYYMTISGHMPYSDNRIVAPYRDIVRALPYSETTQNYIATAMEVDKALEILIQRLTEAGKLDNTLIVAAADHIPYFDVAVLEELTGRKFGDSEQVERLDESALDFDVYKNTLIMWSASMKEPVQVDKVCGQVDILPTISNLLGLEYDSRMLAGGDILSDREGMVIFSSSSWKSDKGFYNRYTQEFTPAPGVTMSQSEIDAYVSSVKKLVRYKLESTHKIVENDFYDVVFGH